ncbi:MAG: SO_0444 family Cu/Zn efflux transporter [bacterium]
MEMALGIVLNFWGTLSQMAPYLLLGFLAAGLLSVLVSPETIERHLGGRGPWPVVKASLVGVPLPLCSCSVIPVAVSLSRHGSSKGATTAFLLSTPQTGVDSILATYSLLGPVFAIFRPLAAFVSGLVGGWLVDAFERSSSDVVRGDECHEECCAPGVTQNRLVRILHHGFVVLPRDIGRPMVIGLIIAGVITVIIPDGLFSAMIGTGIVSMLVMMAIGIPIYVCATASVPIAAAMMAKGVSPGAALVFLMTGPATNAASLAAVWKVMGRRTALIYLGATAGTALASGLLLDWLLPSGIVTRLGEGHTMLPGWFASCSAVVLCGVLGVGVLGIGRRAERRNVNDQAEAVTTFKIGGMTCEHCAELVRKALLAEAGVLSARVSLADETVEVGGSKLDVLRIKHVVQELGYSLMEEKGAGAASRAEQADLRSDVKHERE